MNPPVLRAGLGTDDIVPSTPVQAPQPGCCFEPFPLFTNFLLTTGCAAFQKVLTPFMKGARPRLRGRSRYGAAKARNLTPETHLDETIAELLKYLTIKFTSFYISFYQV